MNVHAGDWSGFVVAGDDGAAHLDLAVEGVHCAACMRKIEHRLSDLPGVMRARLNLTTHRLAVDWQGELTSADHIVAALDGIGYKAHPFDPGAVRNRGDEDARELLRSLAVAGFAAMNVMLLSISVWSGNVTDITPETRDFFHWVSALIALPAAAYAGRPFYRSAGRALRSGSMNMDVPIAIGVSLALALSVLQTVQHAEHAYFDSAIMLLFFLLTGRYLDQNMRRNTRSFAENLSALRSESATCILPNGDLKDLPLSRVEPGALVLVRPGERVSVDGVIEDGASEIDQSLVTGETALQPCGRGDDVFAGTLNGSGALRVRVRAAVRGTLLDEVNKLLEAAAQGRSRYVRLADKAARLYAPLVHGAAALAFVGWVIAGIGWQPALVIAISVLIITCPCALGLAIPAVQVVSSGLLFRRGVLLHSGDALERLAVVDTVVFDKTGTLTRAEASLAGGKDYDPEDLALAASLARTSCHPLAVALAHAVPAAEPILGAREIAGGGVEAEVGGECVRLGSLGFCGASEDAGRASTSKTPSCSVIAMRRGNLEPVIFYLEQVLRGDAVDVVRQLQESGCAVEILSGDREEAVRDVARALGVDRWQAELAPGAKIARLQDLAAAGRKVLMVGDGLNDAPALAAAHVSMSPVTAVQLSQAAADAVFLGEGLAAVPSALGVARRARAAMSQNLWLATAYNIVAVPFAVAGFVTPLLAALAMSGSSVVVTLNALRLRLGTSDG